MSGYAACANDSIDVVFICVCQCRKVHYDQCSILLHILILYCRDRGYDSHRSEFLEDDSVVMEVW